MFTGIIEELAEVEGLDRQAAGAKLAVSSKVCSLNTKISDSISINGVCLTVVGKKDNLLSFDISSETLKTTNIGQLKPKDRVNIEPSLKMGEGLSGHFVTGHIDGIGKIVSRKSHGEFIRLEIEIPMEFAPCLANKGSISADGISLTVNDIRDNIFSVMLIPHTISNTTLGFKRRGDSVNIETDILAKYTQRALAQSAKLPTKTTPSRITKNLLKEHGFI